jgi:hypothetical protein
VIAPDDFIEDFSDCDITIALVEIDRLIEAEGNAPIFEGRFTINQVLGDVLTPAERQLIAGDLARIEHWRKVFLQYKDHERGLMSIKASLISVWEPSPTDGHLIADGFHRITAARLAGLRRIGARLAPIFCDL